MHILITGASGFVGQIFAKKVLNETNGTDGAHTVILTDVVEPSIPEGVKFPQNAKCIKADLYSESANVVDKSLDAVYVFHGIMSSGAEADFDLGFKVNFDATRILLDQLRATCPGVRVIYASTQAVYGGEVEQPLDETKLPTPESSYGTEKLMCECLINEYTRRGFLDGLVLRFPTVTVRPGKPTQAASSFYSGLIREPLDGKVCIVPTTNRNFMHWVCSPRVLVENLLYCLTLSLDSLPKHYRVINHPGIGVSIQDMMDSLERVAGHVKLGLIVEEDDPKITAILYSWASDYDNSKPMSLGFARDTSFDRIVKDYKDSLST